MEIVLFVSRIGVFPCEPPPICLRCCSLLLAR